jgi:hypothetical protein
LVNATAVSNRELTPYQEFYDEIEPGSLYRPNLGHYRVIGIHCEALIPLEHRAKSKKLAVRTEPVRLLSALSVSTVLVYAPSRRAVYKTSTVKILEGVPTENLNSEGEIVISEGVDNPLSGANDLQTPSEALKQGPKIIPESGITGDTDSEDENNFGFQENDKLASTKLVPLPPPNYRPPEPVTPTVRPPEPTVTAPPTRKIPENPVEKMLIDDDFVADNPDLDSMDIDALV